MSALLTPEVVAQAVGICALSIRNLLDGNDGLAKRSALAIAVLDPSTGNELYITTFGKLPEDKWTADYLKIARAKAKLAFRLKMSSRAAQQHPQLLEPGDTKHRGGIYHNGIPVGVSGVQSYIDEMIAMWIAAACEMLCRRAFEEVVTPANGETLDG